MSSSSLSDCTGKFAGLFGLKLDEEAGSFLGEWSGESSSGFFFFFPRSSASLMGVESFHLAQDGAV